MKLPKHFLHPPRVFGKATVIVPWADPSQFVPEGGLTIEEFLEFRGIEIPEEEEAA